MCNADTINAIKQMNVAKLVYFYLTGVIKKLECMQYVAH